MLAAAMAEGREAGSVKISRGGVGGEGKERVRITRSSRFVRVGGNEVSRLHRQTWSTGNGSLASSIKRVTYRGRGGREGGRKNSRGGSPGKFAAASTRWPRSQDVTRRSRNRGRAEIRIRQERGEHGGNGTLIAIIICLEHVEDSADGSLHPGHLMYANYKLTQIICFTYCKKCILTIHRKYM